MGYIKEPEGVTLTVDKKILTPEIEKRINDFIKKVRLKIKSLLKVVSKQNSISLLLELLHLN